VTPVRRAAALAVLLGCLLAAHWPAGRVDFVYDDEDFIVGNPAAHSVAAAARAAFQPFPPDQPGRRLYRPLTALSYGADFTLWGGAARGFALTNVALYVAVVLLAWQFLGTQLASASAAWAAALLFAVHPAHAEAVDAIAGRGELLALLLCLLSIRLYSRALDCGSGAVRGRVVRLGASALAYALACGAKETAVVLPALLAAVHLARSGRAGEPPRRAGGILRGLGPHLLVLVAYLAVRWAVLGGIAPARQTLGGAGPAQRIFTVGAVFLEYLRLLLFPATLQVDGYYLASVGAAGAAAPRSLAGLGLAAALLGLLAWLATRALRGSEASASAGERTDRGGLLVGLTVFLGFLLPVSHIVPIGVLMAERLAFAPSLGFVLLCAAALSLPARRLPPGPALRVRPLRVAGALLLAGLALLGVWRTRVRALEWRDAVALWESADRAMPRSLLVKTNLAAELIQRGELDRAERALLEALAIQPAAAAARYNLALIARRRGQLARAAALLEPLAIREPADASLLVDLAEIKAARGDAQGARGLLARARPLASGRPDLEQRVQALARELSR
jgi:tetratricopeptide (TPR) repeat protein